MLTGKGYKIYLGNNTPKLVTPENNYFTLAEKYILLDFLLFKSAPENETAVLAVPDMCTDKIITLYHSSLFAGHQCVIEHI